MVVKTRTGSQIRSHAQKYFNKLERRLENQQCLSGFDLSDSIHQVSGKLLLYGVDAGRRLFSLLDLTYLESQLLLTERALATRSKPKRSIEHY